MSNINTGGPAFSLVGHFYGGKLGGQLDHGMTLRQYAAIHLKVPNSGTDWLDEMIVESNRNELAAKAMQAWIAGPCQGNVLDEYEDEPSAFADHQLAVATAAYGYADAMLKAREQ